MRGLRRNWYDTRERTTPIPKSTSALEGRRLWVLIGQALGRGLSPQQLAILQGLKHGPADLRPKLTGDHSERKSSSASQSRTLRRLRERGFIERCDPYALRVPCTRMTLQVRGRRFREKIAHAHAGTTVVFGIG